MPFYQPHIPPTPPSTNLTGQTILITGATAGLGYAASLQFLRLRASKLIFGVRSITKGHSAAAAMLADPEVRRVNPNAEIKVLELDLVDYESVVGFAGKVGEEVNLKGGKGKGRLDVVLLNAGINLGEFRRCERSGWEMLIQVNYLSNALLALLIYPLLANTPPQVNSTSEHIPTITFVGSMGQAFHSISKTNPPPHTSTSASIFTHFSTPSAQKGGYSPFTQYPTSKFLVSLFVREFAKHIPRSTPNPTRKDGRTPLDSGKTPTPPVIINAVCPGTCHTAADNNLPFYLRIPMNLNRRLRGRSAEEGGRCLVHAAVVLGHESNGRYIANNQISPLPVFADTEEGRAFAERLWRETVQECRSVVGGDGKGFGEGLVL